MILMSKISVKHPFAGPHSQQKYWNIDWKKWKGTASTDKVQKAGHTKDMRSNTYLHTDWSTDQTERKETFQKKQHTSFKKGMDTQSHNKRKRDFYEDAQQFENIIKVLWFQAWRKGVTKE